MNTIRLIQGTSNQTLPELYALAKVWGVPAQEVRKQVAEYISLGILRIQHNVLEIIEP